MGAVWVAMAASLGGLGFAQLVGYEQMVGWNNGAVVCWDGQPSSRDSRIGPSHNVDMERRVARLIGPRVVIPNGATENRDETHHHVFPNVCAGPLKGDLDRLSDGLLWENDRVPSQRCGLIKINHISHPGFGAGRLVHVPGVCGDGMSVYVRRQRASVHELQHEEAVDLAICDLDRPGNLHGHSHPSSFNGEADVTLTSHDFSLSLCDVGLTVADLALPFSDLSLTLVDVGLLAHETGLTARNPALHQQDDKRRYTDNLGNVVILIIGSAATFVGLFKLVAWLGYRRMSSSKQVGVIGLENTKPDQSSQVRNCKKGSDNL